MKDNIHCNSCHLLQMHAPFFTPNFLSLFTCTHLALYASACVLSSVTKNFVSNWINTHFTVFIIETLQFQNEFFDDFISRTIPDLNRNIKFRCWYAIETKIQSSYWTIKIEFWSRFRWNLNKRDRKNGDSVWYIIPNGSITRVQMYPVMCAFAHEN